MRSVATLSASTHDSGITMCNGDSHRPSYGGTIAILKPTFVAGRPMLRRDMSLHLTHDVYSGGTTATVTGLEPGSCFNSHVVIQ